MRFLAMPERLSPSYWAERWNELVLEKEFHPEFTAHDLVNLPNYEVYLKLLIDGAV